MNSSEISEQLKKQIEAITSKRPRQVVEHILKHGSVTTEELKELYGYNHPPRAARDVREAGIPLKTTRVRSSDGRSIGAYEFDTTAKIEAHKLKGRKVFSKQFKKKLIDLYGSACAVCNESYEERYLQIDHRTPYEVAGELVSGENHPEEFMLICGTCNTKKNYSCKNCSNWTGNKQVEICRTCYWWNPRDYIHIALRPIRRMDITWTEDEVGVYDKLKRQAVESDITIQELIKRKLEH